MVNETGSGGAESAAEEKRVMRKSKVKRQVNPFLI
jgi:hypothetical protein